jgi:LPS-assembly lipoprotein
VIATMRMFTNYHTMSAQAAGRRRGWMRVLLIAAVSGLAVAALVGLSGCGFKARGLDLGLAFKHLKIEGNQAVTKDLQRILRNEPSIKLVEKSAESEVVLELISQSVNNTVIAFNSAGRPREIQLRTRVVYRITDRFGVELVPPQELSQTRDISVSESEALALANAEEFMKNDMNRDIAQQLVRRLRAVKLPAP